MTWNQITPQEAMESNYMTWAVLTHQTHPDAPASHSNSPLCSLQDNPRPTYSTTSPRKHLRRLPSHPQSSNRPRSSFLSSNLRNPESQRVENPDSSTGSPLKRQMEAPWTKSCRKPLKKPFFSEFFLWAFVLKTRFFRWISRDWGRFGR